MEIGQDRSPMRHLIVGENVLYRQSSREQSSTLATASQPPWSGHRWGYRPCLRLASPCTAKPKVKGKKNVAEAKRGIKSRRGPSKFQTGSMRALIFLSAATMNAERGKTEQGRKKVGDGFNACRDLPAGWRRGEVQRISLGWSCDWIFLAGPPLGWRRRSYLFGLVRAAQSSPRILREAVPGTGKAKTVRQRASISTGLCLLGMG